MTKHDQGRGRRRRRRGAAGLERLRVDRRRRAATTAARRISVVGFSVLEAANEPVFEDFEETDAGEGVTFETSYGASGDQSRAVEGGARRRRRALLARARRDPPGRRGPGRRGLEGQRRPRASPPPRSSSFVVRAGQPREHRDLGRPGQAGRRDHHARTRLVRLGASGTSSPPGRTSPARVAREDEAKAFVTKLLEQHHRAARLGS